MWTCRSAWADRSQRNHHRPTTHQVTAPGELNAGGEERRPAVGAPTACTDRCGDGRRSSESGPTRRAAQAPPVDPTALEAARQVPQNRICQPGGSRTRQFVLASAGDSLT
jgi:hypothetical protein